MHTRQKVFLGWAAVLVWMGVISFASTDTFSAAHTSRIIEPLLRWLSGNRLSAAAIEEIHFYIRKLAHVTEYAILAVIVRNAFRQSIPTRRELPVDWLVALFSACYAAADEFHQSFVPSRTASVRDVMIDTVGALLGLALAYGVRRLRLRRRSAANLPRPAKS